MQTRRLSCELTVQPSATALAREKEDDCTRETGQLAVAQTWIRTLAVRLDRTAVERVDDGDTILLVGFTVQQEKIRVSFDDLGSAEERGTNPSRRQKGYFSLLQCFSMMSSVDVKLLTTTIFSSPASRRPCRSEPRASIFPEKGELSQQ